MPVRAGRWWSRCRTWCPGRRRSDGAGAARRRCRSRWPRGRRRTVLGCAGGRWRRRGRRGRSGRTRRGRAGRPALRERRGRGGRPDRDGRGGWRGRGGRGAGSAGPAASCATAGSPRGRARRRTGRGPRPGWWPAGRWWPCVDFRTCVREREGGFRAGGRSVRPFEGCGVMRRRPGVYSAGLAGGTFRRLPGLAGRGSGASPRGCVTRRGPAKRSRRGFIDLSSRFRGNRPFRGGWLGSGRAAWRRDVVQHSRAVGQLP